MHRELDIMKNNEIVESNFVRVNYYHNSKKKYLRLLKTEGKKRTLRNISKTRSEVLAGKEKKILTQN